MRDDNRGRTLELLLETIHSIRSEAYPHIPANLVNNIVEVEAANEEHPERAVPVIEEAIGRASKSRVAGAKSSHA